MKKPRDPISAYTHMAALIFALIVTPFVLYKAVIEKELLPVIIYMNSMIILFAASTCYHTFTKGVEVLKRIDHCSIFLLIAGTYTPFCLISLRGRTGYILLAVIWSIAIAGTVFKLFFVHCPRWLSSVIYITMGWSVVFTLPQLLQTLNKGGFVLLLVGGIIYTVGGVIYALKPKIFKNEEKTGFGNHELFHLFVNAGTLCHFLCIALFVL